MHRGCLKIQYLMKTSLKFEICQTCPGSSGTQFVTGLDSSDNARLKRWLHVRFDLYWISIRPLDVHSTTYVSTVRLPVCAVCCTAV